jgi:type I restriction enzyme S subunit
MASEWRDVTIESIATRIAMGPFGSDIKTDNFVPSGVPVIRGGNLTGGRFNGTGFVFLTEEKANDLANANAFPSDIVLTHRGTLGQVGIIPREPFPRYVVSQSQIKLTCDRSQAISEFIYYYFKSPTGQNALLMNTSQTGVPAISRPVTSLKGIQLLLPPIEEQRAIAHILGTLDDKIELSRRANETLESMARTLFKAWFVDFEPVRAKTEGRWQRGQSLPGMPAHLYDLFPDRLVESELGEIPEGWEMRSLDSIANYLNGLALRKFPPESGDEFLPVIKIAQLRAGSTNGADRASTRIKPEYVVVDGDVLFSWSGSLEVEVWNGGRGALNQHLFKVTSDTVPKWFYFFATRHHLQNFRAIAADKATTMGHIQRKHLTDARVAVASPEGMKKFDIAIAPLFDQLVSNAQQSRSLAQLRDTLLPKLISGELRVGEVDKVLGGVI